MKKLSRIMIIALVASSISGSLYGASPKIYDDVPLNHWAYEAVADLTEKGLLQGLPNGSFKGEKPLTRYSFAVIVKRMLDRYNVLIKNNNEISSKDVKALEDLVTEFINEIESLSEDVKSLRKDVSEVKTDLADAKSNISELNSKTANLETKLSDFGNMRFSGDILAQGISYQKTAKNVDSFNNLQVRIGFNAKPSDKVEADFRYVAYDNDFDSRTDQNALMARNTDRQGKHEYNGLSKSNFGRAKGSNDVEIANIKVKDIFKEGDKIKVGRDFTTHGHGLVINDYSDSITYSTKSGEVDLEAGVVFADYYNGISWKNDKPIWKVTADAEKNGHNIYAGIYTQKDTYVHNTDAAGTKAVNLIVGGTDTNQDKIYKDQKRVITEVGSKGRLSNDGKVRYDIALVASSNERKNMKNLGKKDKATGYMEHIGIAWDAEPKLTVKTSYTTADEKFDGIISIDKNQGSIDGNTTTFDDIARFQNLLGGMMNDKFYNTSDFKIELNYALVNNQSLRFAYDWVKNNKDSVKTGFTENGQKQSNWNMTNQTGSSLVGMNKLNAKIATLEYKYQFDSSSRLSFGFSNADLSSCRDCTNQRFDSERIIWTELLSRF